jgi:hypothetical protein
MLVLPGMTKKKVSNLGPGELIVASLFGAQIVAVTTDHVGDDGDALLLIVLSSHETLPTLRYITTESWCVSFGAEWLLWADPTSLKMNSGDDGVPIGALGLGVSGWVIKLEGDRQESEWRNLATGARERSVSRLALFANWSIWASEAERQLGHSPVIASSPA